MASMANLRNDEAEQSILSAIFCKPDMIYEIQSTLKATDFYHASNQLIYMAMIELAVERVPIEIVSTIERLRKDGNLDKAGGVVQVTTVANTVSTAAYVNQHIEIVKGLSQRRRLMVLSRDIETVAGDVSEELDFPTMQSKLAGIVNQRSDGIKNLNERLVDFAGWMDDRAKNGDNGVMSGIAPLDLLTHGWQPTDLIILAARPSMGKSAMALRCALGAALNHHKTVAYYSLEMSDKQLIARMAANVSGVNSVRISQAGDLNDSEWAKVIKAEETLSHCNLFIETEHVSTPMDIYSRSRQIQGKHGLDLIVIDHMHLMTGGRKGDANNRVQEMSYISRQLKLMAMEMNIPVIALSQLSRAVEARKDKHPMLSDLRDSGSIEQDADMVVFLYRDQYYNPQPGAEDIVEVSIGKNRNGPLGSISLKFQKETSRFLPCPFSGTTVRGRDIPA